MSDVEANRTAPAAEEGTCGPIPKRRQLFLLFGLVSFTWCSFLLYMMHDIHLTDRQSYMDNLDFKGADIDSIFGVETASACYQRCEQHESCLAYTFVKSEQVCWLKGEGYTTKSNPNTISGAINATLAAIRRTAATEKPKDNFDEFSRDDDSWEEGDRYRDEWGDDDGRDAEEGVYSFRRVKVTTEDVERFEDSTNLLGDVRVMTDVRSVAECQDYCVSDMACIVWTLDKARHLCLLRLAGVGSVRYSRDFISARLSATELAQRVAAEDGRGAGAAPANSSAADEEDDAAFYGRMVGPKRQKPYAGPPWPLPSERGGDAVQELDNFDLLGGDKQQLFDVETAAECREACATAASFACAAWTLSKKEGTCWLKNASHTRIAQNRSRGLISGLVAARASR